MTPTRHRQPGYIAAMLHRLSGLALAVFLPLHFLALGTALRGADALDSFLGLTNNNWVKSAEWGLVVALAMHLALGLRVLAIEWLPWREPTAALVSGSVAAAFGIGLLFLFNGA